MAGLGYAVFHGEAESFRTWLSGVLAGRRPSVTRRLPAKEPTVTAVEAVTPQTIRTANGKIAGSMPTEPPAKADEGGAIMLPDRMDDDAASPRLAVPKTDSAADRKGFFPDRTVPAQTPKGEKASPSFDIDVLDKIALVLKADPLLRINAVGYTDSSGEYSYNKSLSKFRANMVKSYLVGKGVPAGQIRTDGLGPLRPIDSNETAEGRQINRRVEIEFFRRAQ